LGIWRERHLWTTVRMLRPIGWDAVWPSVCVPFSLAHLESLGHTLYHRRHEWDVLEFAHVTDDPAVLSSMVLALTSAGLGVATVVEPDYPYVNLSGSWDGFYRGKSANLRKNIRRLLNQSERLGVQYRRTDGRAAYEALKPIFELHVRRWSQYGLPSVYATDTYRAFIKALCNDFADTRAVVVHSLRLDERALAVIVCFECGDTMYLHHTAFDEEFARLAPGKLLLYFVLRDAFGRGFEKFDPGLGRDTYKYAWTNATRTLCWFRVSVNRNARTAMWTEDSVLRPVWRTAKRHWRRLRRFRPRRVGRLPTPKTESSQSGGRSVSPG
jgi:CelD/BcsL family acetyltransferase involved in cellulose biosynthesis